MSSINVDRETKQTFDDLQNEDQTQAEFVQELLETYQKDVDGIVINPDEIAEEIKKQVATEVELAAYRGVSEALDP